MRHELRHVNCHVSEGMLSETVLGGKSTDTAIIMQAGESAANRQKFWHKGVLAAMSLLRITIRLNCLKVDYTFLRGCAKKPNLN